MHQDYFRAVASTKIYVYRRGLSDTRGAGTLLPCTPLPFRLKVDILSLAADIFERSGNVGIPRTLDET